VEAELLFDARFHVTAEQQVAQTDARSRRPPRTHAGAPSRTRPMTRTIRRQSRTC
jgi:hypothetical protein